MTSSDRRSRFGGRALVALVALAVAFGWASPASAQRSAADIESARQLYNQGIELRDHGDLTGALEKFRAAHALGNTPITGLDLCKTHAALGQPVEAREICLGVGRIPVAAAETARSQQARAEAASIAESVRPRIAGVRLRIQGVPAGREPVVVVDHSLVPNAALGELRAVNPGMHEISARVGSGPETKASIELREGESRDIELVVQPPPEPAPVAVVPSTQGPPQAMQPEPQPRKKKGNGLATAGWITGGIGVGIGAIAGLIAMSGENSLEDRCPGKICGKSDHDDLQSARSWGTLSTVFFVIGGVGLGTGIIATVTHDSGSSTNAKQPSRPTVTPVVGLGGAGVHGTF